MGEVEAIMETALDFGCGNGVMLPTLAEHFRSVVGYDKHTEAARSLKVKLGLDNVEIRKSELPFYLPFLDKSFDMIWASSALEHVKHLDSIFWQFHRVLKPGGQFLLLSPSENWIYRLGRKLFRLEKPKDHYHTAQEIITELKKYFVLEIRKSWPIGLNIYSMARFRKE